jgi:hypothetical protein
MIFSDDKRLRRVMKNTKQKDLNIFKGSKFIDEKFKKTAAAWLSFTMRTGSVIFA